MCYAPVEYCAPVWNRSSHAKKIDPLLNKACRVIKRTLRPTPTNTLFKLAGRPTAPPNIRRQSKTKTEERKQTSDSRHHCILTCKFQVDISQERVLPLWRNYHFKYQHRDNYRVNQWKDSEIRNPPNNAVQDSTEVIADGALLPRRDWCG